MATRTKRLLVYSGDRVSGTTTDYAVEISPAYNDIVYVEWSSCSVPGKVLHIEEFAGNGRTSNNTYYWRFPAEAVNSRYPLVFDPPDQARSIRRLTLHWRNADGSVPEDFAEHTLELELWERWGL